MSMLSTLKYIVKRIPVVSGVARAIYARVRPSVSFEHSGQYWEQRYRTQGDSGDGSYGRLARFKAEVLNGFVVENRIATVIEFGCGDGAQLSLASYPAYIGVDVSETVLEKCRARFRGDASKQFVHTSNLAAADRISDLALSLDVVYHLVEDEVFETYMRDLFGHATHWVIVYASNKDEQTPSPHVRHRRFTDWVAAEQPGWVLDRKIDQRYSFDPNAGDNTSFADFYIFRPARSC